MNAEAIERVIKAAFGPCVLFLLAWLAWHILHGEVTQANSYGLDAIEGGLIAMAGGYTQWAFGARIPSSEEGKETTQSHSKAMADKPKPE